MERKNLNKQKLDLDILLTRHPEQLNEAIQNNTPISSLNTMAICTLHTEHCCYMHTTLNTTAIYTLH